MADLFDFGDMNDNDGFDFDTPQEIQKPQPSYEEPQAEAPKPRKPMGSSKPQPNHNQVRENTLPNPNATPQNRQRVNRDYDGNGTQNTRAPQNNQRPQQNRPNPQQNRPTQPQNNQNQQQVNEEKQLQMQIFNQMTPEQQQKFRALTPEQRRAYMNQAVQNYRNMQAQQAQNNASKPKKKKKKLPLIILLVLIVLIVIVVIAKKKKDSQNTEPTEAPVEKSSYEMSGKYAYDTLLNALHSDYSAESLDSIVGTTNGDSYLAQEWAYANMEQLHCEYLQKIGSLVQFEYPMIAEKRTDGSETGNQIESMMNNGEAVKVTIPDYAKIAETVASDGDYIRKMVSTAEYKDTDYTWNDEIGYLMFQYVLDMEQIPTKQVELTLNVGLYNNSPIVQDDAPLDDLLFGSEDFHNLMRVFDQQVVGYTGFKDEIYYEDEEQPNPEYTEWLKLFNKYYEEDNGVFDRNKSKWEPWYLRNDKNEIQYDENGEKIVNYYSVKDENGKDWIEPDKTVIVAVEKHRDVPDEWVEEKTIKYSLLGTHYIQTEYKGDGVTAFRVGDGSKNRPAGIGTPIITKILCTDGKYHDVRVALMGYWVGQDAIDYAEKFDTRNRGFTTVSVVKLICFEVQIQNLENKPITFEFTEMTLADGNSNISSRTGTMYGFSQNVTLEGKETKVVNDWASSTELEQKYAVWGKDFGRQFPMVYFDCLAGTGYIPPYSAYKAFTGQSTIDETVKVEPTTQKSTEQTTQTTTEAQTEAQTEE